MSENLPVLHPDSAAIHEQLATIEAVPLDRLVLDAIKRAQTGNGPQGVTANRDSHGYTAHDYTENPVFQTSFGAPVRNVEAHSEWGTATAPAPNGSTVRIDRIRNNAGSYVKDNSDSIIVEDNDGAVRRLDLVRDNKDGRILKTPRATMYDSETKLKKTLTPGEETVAKRIVADAFGLKYSREVEDSKLRLYTIKGAKVNVPTETSDQVNDHVAELLRAGLTGKKLRAQLIRDLHPDATGDSSELSLDKFSYASALDLDGVDVSMLSKRTVTLEDAA